MDKNKFWQQELPAEQFNILFEHGTERPFSSELNNEKGSGTFICAACNTPLFKSSKKFDSGTGWPSFFESIENSIGEKIDVSHFMMRTEYHCKNCEGHQGHIFKDGPQPTGLRYCNNGLALKFIPFNVSLPEIKRV